MKTMVLLIILQFFSSCINEVHENETEIIGEWNLTREIIILNREQNDTYQTKEVLHQNEAIVYDFGKENQLLIKEQGKPSLLMRYSCYSDVDGRKEKIQQYMDINANTFIMSYSDGKLILDATQSDGSILYFERI